MDENNRNKMKYATLSNKILNVRFLASLSGATDVYDVFSELVQKLQTVCLLPHERFDQAMLIVSKFSQMLDTVDIVNCCCDDNNNNDGSACLWPNFHMDIKSLESREPSFRKVPIGMIAPEELNTRAGSRTNLTHQGQDISAAIQSCKQRLTNVLGYLNKHLSEDVFNKKDRGMIENIRNLLSLSKMHMQCSVSGFHHVANMSYHSFYKESIELRIPELQLIAEGQFRLFLKLLSQEKLGDSDSNLFKEILMKSEKYTDVSLIIHILVLQ